MAECLTLKKSNCKNCYKCIRHCPVKSIRFSGNQAHIIGNECILCGHCFVVCPQNAKEIVDETEKARVLIQSGAPVYVSLAPSFIANYDGIGIGGMRKALKKLGFADVEETAIGATIVKAEYERMLAEDDRDVIISSCCHSVNLLIQKYFPAELHCLADILSPMQAHCADIRRRHPDARTVFIGPCVAKKDEAQHYTGLVDAVLELDARRRALVTEADALKARRNEVSKSIGARIKAGEDASAAKEETRALGDAIAAKDIEIREAEAAFREAMLRIPNVPNKDIATGPDSSANRDVRHVGTEPTFAFEPLDHIALGERLGIFDFPRGVKLTGTGFPILLGQGAKLQRALIQYMLDLHTQRQGYTEMLPPFVVNTASMVGTGQLPKMRDDMYHCEVDDFWLIPTAEVPVTNFYRDDILDARQLPVKLTAYTPCFRREAGSAGKDTRGILRVHQFDKVEMVKFVAPETSYDELEKLVKDAEDVLTGLGLYFRVLELCSGDISFSAAKCYDLELWAPGQKGWLEVSSCSNFESFQARRANIRYRRADGKPDFVHTLNGSGVALPRLMIAILEQCQQADGSVLLPEAIRPYFGGDRLLPVR